MLTSLRRLRKAVRKVRFLLSFNIHKFLLRSSSRSANNRIGFKEYHSPGLLDAVSVADTGSEFDVFFDALTPEHLAVATPIQQSPSPVISRTISSTWSAIDRSVARTTPTLALPSRLSSSSTGSSSGDVDARAEEFINRFRARLRMERQESLELRYASSNRPSSEVTLA